MSPPLSAGGDSIGKIAAANTEGGVDVVHLVFLRLVTECRAAALRSYAEECHGGRIPRRCAHDGSRGGFENAVAIVVAMRDRGLERIPRDSIRRGGRGDGRTEGSTGTAVDVAIGGGSEGAAGGEGDSLVPAAGKFVRGVKDGGHGYQWPR